MSNEIKFEIDGKKCVGKAGQKIVDAAKENGVYIPTLCHFDGLKPVGTCRICTVKVGGRPMAACTSVVTEGMKIASLEVKSTLTTSPTFALVGSRLSEKIDTKVMDGAVLSKITEVPSEVAVILGIVLP